MNIAPLAILMAFANGAMVELICMQSADTVLPFHLESLRNQIKQIKLD